MTNNNLSRRALAAVRLDGRQLLSGGGLSALGGVTLEDYFDRVVAEVLSSEAAVSQTVLDAIHGSMTARGQGDWAPWLVAQLRKVPLLVSAQHGGFSTYHDDVQCTIMCSALQRAFQRVAGIEWIVPVVSCGLISLGNLSFPGGIVLFPGPSLERRRLRVMAASGRNTMVWRAPAYTAEMIERACGRAENLRRSGVISPSESAVLSQVLRRMDAALGEGLVNFSAQAGWVNEYLWLELTRMRAPKMVWLSREDIVARIVLARVGDPKSAMWRILFDPVVRCDVLTLFEDHQGCWSPPSERGESRGSVFFWGVAEDGRRIGLKIDRSGAKDASLVASKGVGTFAPVALRPLDVRDALTSGRIVPGTFVCYVALHFTEGVACVGGFSEAVRSGRVKEGLIDLMGRYSGFEQVFSLVEDSMTSASIGFVSRLSKSADYVEPTGMIDLLRRGGLDEDDATKVDSVSLEAAILAYKGANCVESGRGVSSLQERLFRAAVDSGVEVLERADGERGQDA